jgi:hypothetical protein
MSSFETSFKDSTNDRNNDLINDPPKDPFRDLFKDLECVENNERNYFFRIKRKNADDDEEIESELIYKYLMVSRKDYETTVGEINDTSFAIWRIPIPDQKIVMNTMKERKIKLCEVFLRCPGENPRSMCVIPYVKILHDYLSKNFK